MHLLIPLFLATTALAGAALSTDETDAVRQLMREAKLADAATAAAKLTAAHPAEPAAHALLGDVFIAQDKGAEAVKSYELAASLAPNDSGIHLGLAFAYETALDQAGVLTKLSLARKCLAALEKSVALDPENLQSRINLVGYYATVPRLFGGNAAKARAQVDEISKLDPVSGHLVEGIIHLAAERHASASAEFEKVLQSDPANYLAAYQVGRLSALTGENIDRGITMLRHALTLSPERNQPGHDAANWRLGMLLEKKGDKAGAKAAYESALSITPGYKNAARALAKLD